MPPKRHVPDPPDETEVPPETRYRSDVYSPGRNPMIAKSNANPARRRRRPKPTPHGRRLLPRPKSTHPTTPQSTEIDRRNSLDWVMLESGAEAPDLHVTAAPGYRAPKYPIPHAAYRRIELPPKRLPVVLSREETSNAHSRAAEATRVFASQTIQTAEAVLLNLPPLWPPKRPPRHDASFRRPKPANSAKRAWFDDEALTDPKAGQLPHPRAAEAAWFRGEPA